MPSSQYSLLYLTIVRITISYPLPSRFNFTRSDGQGAIFDFLCLFYALPTVMTQKSLTSLTHRTKKTQIRSYVGKSVDDRDGGSSVTVSVKSLNGA